MTIDDQKYRKEQAVGAKPGHPCLFQNLLPCLDVLKCLQMSVFLKFLTKPSFPHPIVIPAQAGIQGRGRESKRRSGK